jgi:hypothetical protein
MTPEKMHKEENNVRRGRQGKGKAAVKTRILIMRPDQPHETRDFVFKHGTAAAYRALKDVIEPITGAPMEHVRVFGDFNGGANYRYLDMFVNELGHLSEPPLPRNEAATLIYRRNVLYHEPGKYDPEELPWIAGPAVLFEKIVWNVR